MSTRIETLHHIYISLCPFTAHMNEWLLFVVWLCVHVTVFCAVGWTAPLALAFVQKCAWGWRQ